MAYFARVTKRPPPQHSVDATIYVNAVIMGRKTWESIPARYRPLKGRINVVVSRSPEKLGFGESGIEDAGAGGLEGQQPSIGAKSIEEGLAALQSKYMFSPGSARHSAVQLGRVFVVGGADIYGATLKMQECRRILITNILTQFECDTFFPFEPNSQDGDKKGARKWVKRGKSVLDGWVREEVPSGVQSEKGVEYEFGLWEREDERDGRTDGETSRFRLET